VRSGRRDSIRRAAADLEHPAPRRPGAGPNHGRRTGRALDAGSISGISCAIRHSTSPRSDPPGRRAERGAGVVHSAVIIQFFVVRPPGVRRHRVVVDGDERAAAACPPARLSLAVGFGGGRGRALVAVPLADGRSAARPAAHAQEFSGLPSSSNPREGRAGGRRAFGAAGTVSRRTMAMAGTDEADGSTMYFDLVERPLQMAFAEGYTLGRRRREMAAGIVGTEDAVERTRRLRRGWMRCAAREDEGRWRFFLDPRGMSTFLIHFAAGSKKNYDRFVVSSIHSKSAPMTSLPLKFTNATCS